MFQFPRFPPRLKVGAPGLFIQAGCPIRRSSAELARQLTEAYRSRATSFIGPQRLGIHRAPLVALTTIPLPPQLAWLGSLRSSLSIRFLTCVPAFRRACQPKLPLAGRSGGETSHEKAGPVADPRSHQTLFSLTYSIVEDACFKLTSSLQSAWWSRGDSNPRHPPCKGGALPTELRPHFGLVGGGRWWTRTTDLGLIRTAL